MRVVNGRTPGEGRVEIFHNNAWATVCNDRWDNTDAALVCRQLGLSPSGVAINNVYTFGAGTGMILLDQVHCNSRHTNIFDCPHNGFGNQDCNHSHDAGVRCSGAPGEFCYYCTVCGFATLLNLPR